MKTKIFITLIFLMTIAFMSCNGGGSGDTPQDIARTSIPVEVIPDEPEEPEDPIVEVTGMKAVLFYDGSVKNWDGSKVIKLYDAESCSRAGDYFLIDKVAQKIDGTSKWDIPVNAEKACFYGGKVFFYGEKTLYMSGIKKAPVEIAYNNLEHDVAMTPIGVSFELYFFTPEGANISGQYGGVESILKMEKVTGIWHQYMYDEGSWTEVGSGVYSIFTRCHSLDIAGKTYYTKGAILDRENQVLTQPSFSSTLGKFVGGSAFREYIQPVGDKPCITGIGAIGNTGYFLNARTGAILVYNSVSDTISEWVTIVTGTGNDSITESETLFNSVNAFICDGEIIYFDGAKIQRLNISTGEKNEIAEATYFKGWSVE